MINKENMKKAQRDLFDFLENIIKKKYDDLVLECFLKFKNKTVFEKTMKRILKGKDPFDCDEYKINLDQLEFIIAELQKLKKKKKKKSDKKSDDKKKLKKVGDKCTKDEECKGKGCCDKGKCEKGNKKVCKNKGKPESANAKKKLKKVGDKCTKDEECKGKGCCDKGKCEKGNKKVCKNKGKPESANAKKTEKKNKLTKEDCEQWEKNKKNIKNDKVINIKNGKPIKYAKKNGNVTKKVSEINKECDKVIKKSPPKPKKSPPKKPRKNLSNEYDEDECKQEDDCDSKCCKNNQCVDGSICKQEKKNKKIKEKMEKKLISEEKKAMKRAKNYELFESTAIGHIKDLTAQISRRNSKQMKSAYNKLLGKVLEVYNKRFLDHAKLNFNVGKIPIEIKRHLDFLQQRIIINKTPTPTPSPEPSQSPSTLFETFYVKLMESNPPEDLLDDIIKKYNIEFDFQTPPNNYQKMIAIAENYKAIHDKKIQDHMNNISDSLRRDILRIQEAEFKALMDKEKENKTFSEEEIEELSEIEEEEYESDFESESKSKSKSKTPPKSKSLSKSNQKILDDLNNNKLNQEDMDKILKKLNLKTQKEYLKTLILIGLNKI